MKDENFFHIIEFLVLIKNFPLIQKVNQIYVMKKQKILHSNLIERFLNNISRYNMKIHK